MFRIITTVLLWIAVSETVACDACGCAAGSSPGFTSFQNRSYIGLTYLNRTFRSEHPSLFGEGIASVSSEQFHSIEFSGKYVPHRHLQLSASMPYQHFVRKEAGEMNTYSGIGDLLVTAQGVFATPGEQNRNTGYRITAGGGVKFPTGNTNPRNEEKNLLTPALQPGSGSLDFVALAGYLQRYKSWGIYTEASYRWNRENNTGYKFGNRGNAGLRILRWISVSDSNTFALQPEAALLYEHASPDRDQNHGRTTLDDVSGGYFLDVAVGLNAILNNLNIGVTFRHPLRQYYAAGMVTQVSRFSVNLNYLFNTKPQ